MRLTKVKETPRYATVASMLNEKVVFTTGEAAWICMISQQMIIRSFDSGNLQGFRVPGSKFRRIPRKFLIAFMEKHKIPRDRLPETKEELAEKAKEARTEDELDELVHA